jgi:hypothetical protein
VDAHVYCGRVFDTMTPSKVQVKRLLRKLSRNPIQALQKVAALTKEVAVVETIWTCAGSNVRPWCLTQERN